MKYSDIHTHLLPDMDDGARDIEDSLALIDSLKKYGVDTFAFTPHFYTNKENISSFLERRQQSLDSIKDELPQDIKYVLGAEVFVTDFLFTQKDINALCIGDTNYLLTEFSYDITFEKAIDRIEQLTSLYGVIPIIAHIERYPNLLKPAYIERLIYLGARIQVNIDFFKRFFAKYKVGKLVKRGLIHYIATDTHSMKSRHPDFKQWAEQFIKLYGREAFMKAMLNSNELLS